MSNKVLIIGIDGGAFDWISSWKTELPNLNRLMEEGSYGILKSTIPWQTIPAWPSFATSTNPGKHSLFDFFKRKEGTYEVIPDFKPSLGCKKKALWKILSDKNKKVLIINVPATYPPQKVKGFMISGLLTPSIKGNSTYPPELKKEVLRIDENYGISYSYKSADDPKKVIENLNQLADSRAKVTLSLLEKHNFDFAMVVFNGTDKISHEYAHYLDKEHPRNVKSKINPILEHYKKVDENIGKLISFSEKNGFNIVIMSDHGFQTIRRYVNINNWLIKEGLMKIKKNIKSRIKYGFFKLGFTPSNVYQFLEKLRLDRLIYKKSQSKGFTRLMNIFFNMQDIDWKDTKAYAMGSSGLVYLNLKGREPKGCVKSENYESIRNEIIEKLKQLVDPRTGKRVVKNVFKSNEIYFGKHIKDSSDLVTVFERGYKVFGHHNFPYKDVFSDCFSVTGDHTQDGIFVFWGPDIKKLGKIEKASIMDITPTVLQIFGLNIPEGMDGKVLNHLIK